MKNIDINYQNNIFEVKIKSEKAFPDNLYKVEFESSELLQIINSHIWIVEKGNLFSFIHIDYENTEQVDLLQSIAVGIEEHNFKDN